MRRVCHTSYKQQIPLAVAILLILVLAVVLFLLMLRIGPDHFEDEAVVGVPVVTDAETYGYESYDAIGVAKAALCGMPKIIDGRDVQFYLTNPEDNTVAIKLEVYTPKFVPKSDGTYEPVPDVLLGESGFVRPGEYVETVRLHKPLKEPRTNVMIKISTLDETTGRSHGYFFVNTVLVR